MAVRQQLGQPRPPKRPMRYELLDRHPERGAAGAAPSRGTPSGRRQDVAAATTSVLRRTLRLAAPLAQGRSLGNGNGIVSGGGRGSYHLSRITYHSTGRGRGRMEATPGFEPGIRALQAPALPLGHVAARDGDSSSPAREGQGSGGAPREGISALEKARRLPAPITDRAGVEWRPRPAPGSGRGRGPWCLPSCRGDAGPRRGCPPGPDAGRRSPTPADCCRCSR